MASLEIKTFLSIKKANIELRPFNIFIGPQAQGKSVIVKLVYLFETFTFQAFNEIVSDEITVTQWKKIAQRSFEEIFPKYSWADSSFEIMYKHGDLWLQFSRKGVRTSSPVKFDCSESFSKLVESSRETFTKLVGELEQASGTSRLSSYSIKRKARDQVMAKIAEWRIFSVEPIFIPASRSFFANIERNIFSLISKKLEIDPLVARFGEIYERLRFVSREFAGKPGRTRRQNSKTETRISNAAWLQVLHGEYVFDGETEYIENDRRRVKLMNSSSGQQEAIPLLFVLEFANRLAMFQGNTTSAISFYIEEPEAHLFPKAQRTIASLLALSASQNANASFSVTTHSPYLLSAFNNLTLAGRLYQLLPVERHHLIEKIVPKQMALPPADLAAYEVNNGHVNSILDVETGLVNGYLIDQVSEEFSAEFDQLLELLPKSSANTGASHVPHN